MKNKRSSEHLEPVEQRQQRAERLRAKRLAKKEKLDKLQTGNFSIWQMSKCLGPKRARKIGLEMQRIIEFCYAQQFFCQRIGMRWTRQTF